MKEIVIKAWLDETRTIGCVNDLVKACYYGELKEEEMFVCDKPITILVREGHCAEGGVIDNAVVHYPLVEGHESECVWKSYPAIWITECCPNKKVPFIRKDGKYCPYCGKPIRIEEAT